MIVGDGGHVGDFTNRIGFKPKVHRLQEKGGDAFGNEEAGDADREDQDRGNHPVGWFQPGGVMRLFLDRGGRNLGVLVRELRLGIGKRARCIAVSQETHVYSGS